MATENVTVRETCRKCEGTGIVHNPWDFKKKFREIGFVCPWCKGEGYTEYTYEPFVERRPTTGVEHVFSWPRDEFHTRPLSKQPSQHLQYSISYDEWLSGDKPAELIESFYCPYDIFCSDEYFYEPPCSRCAKCRKKHPGRYQDDKAKCWEEVRSRRAEGETFPKIKEKK